MLCGSPSRTCGWASLGDITQPSKRLLGRLRAAATGSSSIDWKAQFKRRLAFLQRAASAIAGTNSSAIVPPPPRPLSAYLVQVDFICKKENGERAGIASTLVQELSIDNDTIEIDVGDLLGPQLSALGEFTRADIAIHLIERSSGKQTLIYSGAPEDWIQEDLYYDFFDGFDCIPVLHATSPDMASYVMLQKTGCLCSCGHRRDRFFSVPPPSSAEEPHMPGECECECGMRSAAPHCVCCGCKAKWSCFHQYRISLHFLRGMDEIEGMTEDDTLRILQDALVYS